jgi:hypothetical protein
MLSQKYNAEFIKKCLFLEQKREIAHTAQAAKVTNIS